VRNQNLGYVSKLSAGQRQVDSVRATLKSGENPRQISIRKPAYAYPYFRRPINHGFVSGLPSMSAKEICTKPLARQTLPSRNFSCETPIDWMRHRKQSPYSKDA
jgi:hypothetical protein